MVVVVVGPWPTEYDTCKMKVLICANCAMQGLMSCAARPEEKKE